MSQKEESVTERRLVIEAMCPLCVRFETPNFAPFHPEALNTLTNRKAHIQQ